jgi:hypothetical protein
MHAKIYAVTEKYVVEGLKALSSAKFETACNAQQFTPGDFFSAAEFVYASTVEANKGTRDGIVEAFYQHSGYLDSDTERASLQTVRVKVKIRDVITTKSGGTLWEFIKVQKN